MIDIDVKLNLTKGLGHQVKDQGRICISVKLMFGLWIINGWQYLDDIYISDRFDETFKVTKGEGPKVKVT